MAIATPAPEDVQNLVRDDSIPSTVVTDAISDAVLLVERCVENFSSTRQAAIVRYTAAHLLSVVGWGEASAGAVRSERIGDSSITYLRPDKAENLSGSVFGQQAMMLDETGCLSSIGKRQIKMEVL